MLSEKDFIYGECPYCGNEELKVDYIDELDGFVECVMKCEKCGCTIDSFECADDEKENYPY